MKSSFLFSLLFLIAAATKAQVVAIQNDGGRRLKLCWDNYIKVAVEGLPASAIFLTTDNGTIKQNEYQGPGHYIYSAKTAGRAMIYVKRKNSDGSETNMDSSEYFVQRPSISKPEFGGKLSGKMSQGMILVSRGVLVRIIQCECDARLLVISYSISVHRKKKEIFRRDVQGPLIDSVTSHFFHTLKNGDRIRFTNVKVKDCDEELRDAGESEIIVKDAYKYRWVRDPQPAMEEFVIDPMTGEEVKKITGGHEWTWQRVRKYK